MEVLDQLTAQSPKALLALVLCFIGFALRRSPIKNWLIPWLLMAGGGSVYPIIAKIENTDYTSALRTTNIIFGVGIGFISFGLYYVLKDKFPTLFPKNGDTQSWKKENVPPTEKPKDT